MAIMSYDDENFTFPGTQDVDALSEEWRERLAQRREEEEMAMADYEKCAVCQGKAFYNGDDALESRLQRGSEAEFVCGECAQTHTLIAVPNGTATDLLRKIRYGSETERLTALGALWQLLRPATPVESI